MNASTSSDSNHYLQAIIPNSSGSCSPNVVQSQPANQSIEGILLCFLVINFLFAGLRYRQRQQKQLLQNQQLQLLNKPQENLAERDEEQLRLQQIQSLERIWRMDIEQES
jgi:hypothetical protein